eukprot:g26898.t1
MGDKEKAKEENVDVKSVSVVKADVQDGVVWFLVNVAGKEPSDIWSVKKRYSQFEELQSTIQSSALSAKVPKGCELPPKKLKLFTSHTSPAFIEERRVLLESYLQTLLKVKEIGSSAVFTRFLTSDKQEKKVEKKAKQTMPEDVEITHVCVPNTRTMSDHVLYQVDVCNSRKPQNFSKWTVLKRFTQFADMDALVRASFEGNPSILEQMPPPPKKETKLLNDHLDDVFINHRRVLLESYLQKMIQIEELLLYVSTTTACCCRAILQKRIQIEEVVRNKDFLFFLGVSLSLFLNFSRKIEKVIQL